MVELKTLAGGMHYRILGNYPDAAAALAAIRGKIILAEEDADNQGCWDVAAARGSALTIYCIEPAGRG